MKHIDEIFSWVMSILILFSMIGISWVTYKITKRKFKKESSNNFENQKTDTVYIPEIFTIPEPFEIIMNPSKVEIYRKDTTSKYNEFSLREKDLVLFTPNRLDSLIIDLNYLSIHCFFCFKWFVNERGSGKDFLSLFFFYQINSFSVRYSIKSSVLFNRNMIFPFL